MGIFSKNIGSDKDLEPVDQVRFPVDIPDPSDIESLIRERTKNLQGRNRIDTVRPEQRIVHRGSLVITDAIGYLADIKVTGSLYIFGFIGAEVSLKADNNIYFVYGNNHLKAHAGNNIRGKQVGVHADISARNNVEIESVGRRSKVFAGNNAVIVEPDERCSLEAWNNVITGRDEKIERKHTTRREDFHRASGAALHARNSHGLNGDGFNRAKGPGF